MLRVWVHGCDPGRVSDGSRLALCQTLSIKCPSSIFFWHVYFAIPVPFSLSFLSVCCCCCCFSHSAYWLPTRKNYTLHGGQSRSWSAEQGKENKRKSLAAYPPPTPHTARSKKINKITRRIYRRYAGGRPRVRTRIPSARRLGLWVWLRKILHSRLR